MFRPVYYIDEFSWHELKAMYKVYSKTGVLPNINNYYDRSSQIALITMYAYFSNGTDGYIRHSRLIEKIRKASIDEKAKKNYCSQRICEQIQTKT